MRIIEIAGVQLVVSDKDYNYYWTRRNIGENSDAFKVACRRLLGLGPDSHSFDYGFIQLHIWGDNNKDQCIKKIYESGLIEYEEEWYKNQTTSQLKGAAYTAQREQALMKGLDARRLPHSRSLSSLSRPQPLPGLTTLQGLDDEFEDELEL